MLNEIYLNLPCFPTVDENICQKCGVSYDEDDHQDASIGCDTCGRCFTIGALALTERQAHVKSIFAVIPKNKDK